MKKYRVQLFTVVITIMTFVYVGCNKDEPYTYIDDCAGVECQNGGICIDGSCQCPNGYEGANCETKWLSRYVGDWKFTQTVDVSTDDSRIGQQKSYTATIGSDNGSTTQFVIDGLLGDATLNDVPCVVGLNSDDEFVSSSQFIFKRNHAIKGSYFIVNSGDGTINGSGTVMNGKFEITYPGDSNNVVNETITFTASYVQ